jgi:hypothetical protein
MYPKSESCQVDLRDKDAILVSLYDDITQLDLTRLTIFHQAANYLLQTLEHQFNSTFVSRRVRRKDVSIDTTSTLDVKGAAHADITNLRFLLKDMAQNTANMELRKLKMNAKGVTSAQKTIIKIITRAQSGLVSPLSQQKLHKNRIRDRDTTQKAEIRLVWNDRRKG